MAKHRDLNRGDVLPASWTDAIQEFVSTLTANVRLSLASATAVQAAAGAASAQAAVGIGGRWRYNAATVSATASGTAGVKDIYVVASENAFANTPQPDTDSTDYSFGLQVVASGASPTGTHNGAAIVASRKIGELDWDGAAITGLRQTVGAMDATQPVMPTAPRANVTPVVAVGAAAQTAPLMSARVGTGANVFSVSAAGAVTASSTVNATGYQVGGTALASTHLSDTASLARLASPALTGTPTAPTALAGTNTTQIATTAYVQSMAATVEPLMDGAADVGSSVRYARQDHVHPTDTTRAPLASPGLTGTPTAPTAAAGTNTTQIATTAFVTSAVAALNVASTYVTLASAQTITGAKTFAAGPTIDPGAGTASAVLTLVSRSAGTAQSAATISSSSASSTLTYNSPTGGGHLFQVNAVAVATITGSGINIPTGATYQVNGAQISSANLADAKTGTGSMVLAASPALTGTPTAPTAAVDTSTTQIATTAFVVGQGYAKLASPTFTGTPAAPTAAAGTSTTQIATTAFVQNAVSQVTGGTGGIAYLGNAQTFTGTNTFAAAPFIDPGTGTAAAVLNFTARNAGASVSGSISWGTSSIFTLTGSVTTASIDATVTGATAYSANVVAGQAVIANSLVRGDANRAFRVMGDGKIEWGAGGATALDTNLYRSAANVLKTDDAFQAASYAVGTTPLAASHLSNGTTGTGAVVLAGSPTVTGTFTVGAISSTGNISTTGSMTAGSYTVAGTALASGHLSDGANLAHINAAETVSSAWTFSAVGNRFSTTGNTHFGAHTTYNDFANAGASINGSGYIGVTRAAAGLVFASQLVGDTNSRFRLDADGTQRWNFSGTGSGSNYDFTLTPTAADRLALSATFSATAYQVGSTALAASHLSNGTTGTGAVVLASGAELLGTPVVRASMNFNAVGASAMVALIAGTATNSGYVQWNNTTGQRLGYLGYSNTNLSLNVEQADTFIVTRGSAVTAAAERMLMRVEFGNVQTYSANVATTRGSLFNAPTYAGDVAGRTITTAATVAVAGAPAAGTNMAITNAYALWVQAGLTRLDGNLEAAGATTTITNAVARQLIVTPASSAVAALNVHSVGSNQAYVNFATNGSNRFQMGAQGVGSFFIYDYSVNADVVGITTGAGGYITLSKPIRYAVGGSTGHDHYGTYLRTETTDTGGGSGYANKLYIRNHHGIKYDAYRDGGGHRFYTGYDASGAVNQLAFSIGEGDPATRAYGVFYALGEAYVGQVGTGVGNLVVQGLDSASINMYEASAGVGYKRSRIIHDGGIVSLQTINDPYTAVNFTAMTYGADGLSFFGQAARSGQIQSAQQSRIGSSFTGGGAVPPALSAASTLNDVIGWVSRIANALQAYGLLGTGGWSS